MLNIFVASEIPQESLNMLQENNVPFDYWDHQETITESELILRTRECSILVCGIDVQVTKKVILSAPNLKLIANIGDGYSNIDVKVAKSKGILITNAPTEDSIASTAEQTVTLLLSLSRKLLAGDDLMKHNKFTGWRVTGYVGGHQVYGKKLFVVGLGKVGRKVVEMLSGFQMDMYYTDLECKEKEFVDTYNIKKVSLEDGLKIADYVTINCSLNEENVHMISREELSLMKKTAYLINCGRGPLVKENDLVAALENKQIAGAALDVYEFEPKVSTPLTLLPNVVLTPHAGNATVEARKEMAQDAISNVIHFVNKQPLKYLI